MIDKRKLSELIYHTFSYCTYDSSKSMSTSSITSYGTSIGGFYSSYCVAHACSSKV